MTDPLAPFRPLPRFRLTSDTSFHSCCPAHDDQSPSLRGSLTNNRLLLHCWAGCTVRNVLAALGLTWNAVFYGAKQLSRKEREGIQGFYLWREREIAKLSELLRLYDAIMAWGPWESMPRVQRALLRHACREYTATEWRFEQLRTGSQAEALEVYREG